MTSPRVLVSCEYSGRVRDAFLAAGIEGCVNRCARAPDYWGRWRAERKLAELLRDAGDSPAIAAATARAAVAVGTTIARAGR